MALEALKRIKDKAAIGFLSATTALTGLGLGHDVHAQTLASSQPLRTSSPEYKSLPGLSDEMLEAFRNPKAEVDIRGFNPRQYRHAKIIRTAQQAIELNSQKGNTFKMDLMFDDDFNPNTPRPFISGSVERLDNLTLYTLDDAESEMAGAVGIQQLVAAIRSTSEKGTWPNIIESYISKVSPNELSPASNIQNQIVTKSANRYAPRAPHPTIVITATAAYVGSDVKPYWLELERALNDENGMNLIDEKNHIYGHLELIEGQGALPYFKIHNRNGVVPYGGAWLALENTNLTNRQKAGSMGYQLKEVMLEPPSDLKLATAMSTPSLDN